MSEMVAAQYPSLRANNGHSPLRFAPPISANMLSISIVSSIVRCSMRRIRRWRTKKITESWASHAIGKCLRSLFGNQLPGTNVKIIQTIKVVTGSQCPPAKWGQPWMIASGVLRLWRSA
jgi:hypothetical protein